MDYGAAYGQLHSKWPKKFSGWTCVKHRKEIARLVLKTESLTLLDYGCGKGYQYLTARIHEDWGNILPYCYDPGVSQLAAKPEGTFDGVICTDVMEHIEEADVPEILAEVLSYATRFVYFNIACRPAKRKKLPDGRNVHLTVQPPVWWKHKIVAASDKVWRGGSNILISTEFDEKEL